jgi:hypothetical protein
MALPAGAGDDAVGGAAIAAVYALEAACAGSIAAAPFEVE